MKICARMFNEINFEPNALSPCCDVHGLETPRFSYDGGPVPLKDYAAYIAGIATGTGKNNNICQGCPELEELDNGSNNIYMNFSAISFNMHRFLCNCKCTYCGLWNKRELGTGYDPLPAITSLWEQQALKPNCIVSWGGGEPTILQNFGITAAWITAHNYFQYIHTNGLRFSPSISDMLLHEKGAINISLDSASESVYSNVKGINGFNKVLSNLERYAAANPNAITLKYIVFAKNNSISEIESFLGIARRLGICSVEYSLNFLETRANTVSDKTLIAAAFLKKRALQLGMQAGPFYIDAHWLNRIDSTSL